MKIADIIVSLLNDELRGKPCLLKVDIPIAQGENWTWMLLSFEDIDKVDNIRELKTRILELLSPMYAGEIFGHSSYFSLFYAENDFSPKKSSRNILFQPSVENTLLSYVRDALASSKENLSNFFF